MSDLNRLEAEVGERLRSAMPAVTTPPAAVARIRHRLEAVGKVEPGRMAAPVRQVWRRWAAVAAVAALLVGLSSYQVWRPGGEPGAAALAAPFIFAAQAEAAGPMTSPALPQWPNGFQFRLETALPSLPDQASFWTVRFADSIARLDAAREKLGYSAYPDQPNALFGIDDGSWSYQLDGSRSAAPPPEPQGSQADPAETERIALAWLKQAGLLPKGPLETHAYADPSRPQYGYLSIEPGRESRLRSVGGGLGIGVTVLNGRVVSAGGLWPEAVTGSGSVPLRPVADAWADLQAGVGVQFDSPPWVRGDAVYPDHPTLLVREVRLDRTLVQSLDSRWYMIPVFVFSGSVDDVNGQPHPMAAYVSAVKPQAGQGHFELEAPLPDAPTEAAPLRLQRRNVTTKEQQLTETIEPFTAPTDTNVAAAALRVARAAGFRPEQVAEPKLRRAEPFGFVHADVPLKVDGLPVFESGSNQYLSGVWIDFSLSGQVQTLLLTSAPTTPAGPAAPLLPPDEAWDRVRQGKGMIQVLGRLTFPAAQFAAHRTEITRVELAYVRDLMSGDDVPLEPAYLFWGEAEIGATHKRVEILVILPALR